MAESGAPARARNKVNASLAEMRGQCVQVCTYLRIAGLVGFQSPLNVRDGK
jgi:hypothetical protein